MRDNECFNECGCGCGCNGRNDEWIWIIVIIFVFCWLCGDGFGGIFGGGRGNCCC